MDRLPLKWEVEAVKAGRLCIHCGKPVRKIDWILKHRKKLCFQCYQTSLKYPSRITRQE